MARPAGFEPATGRVEVGNSIQLSYGRALALCLAAFAPGAKIDTVFAMTRPTDAAPPPSPSSTAAAVEAHVVAPVDAATVRDRPLRYYDLVMAAFVAVLLLSNVIGASKLAAIDGHVFGAGILFFPISYVLGDVLTEVYGYARARRVIWAGFAGLIFMAVMSWVVVALPPAPGWDGQVAYQAVFGQVWRIVIASIVAFWAGEFVNSYVLARMKIWTGGRLLWTRTIGSTVVGQGIDSLLFYPIAFAGLWSREQLLTVMITNWALKVGWEVALTPVTYVAVNGLKRREGIDLFDTGTDFTPFRARV